MGRLVLSCLIVLAPAPARAALAEPALGQEVPSSPAVHEAAELKLAGRSVFTFRAPRGAYTPEQRLTAAEALIDLVVEEGIDPSVTQQAEAEGRRILVGGRE